MRYIMKQKVFSLSDKFAIRNEKGEDAFFVNGEVFSLGHKLSFEDLQGNELLFIRQKLLSWGPTYELYRGEEHVATIKKEMFTFFQVHLRYPRRRTGRSGSAGQSVRSRILRDPRRRASSPDLQTVVLLVGYLWCGHRRQRRSGPDPGQHRSYRHVLPRELSKGAH